MAVSASQGSALYRAMRMIVIMGGAILAGMVQLAILPAMPEMGAHFAGDGWDGTLVAQYVTTISALSMAVGGVMAGWAAGRFGKRWVLLISALAYGITGGIGTYAPDLWTLLGSRLLLGVAASGYVTIGLSLIGDYYPDAAQRDRLIGWFTIIGGAGSLVVLKAAALLTEQGGWHGPFALYLSAIPLFLVGLFTITDVRAETAGASAAQWGAIARAWGIYVMIVLISISMYQRHADDIDRDRRRRLYLPLRAPGLGLRADPGADLGLARHRQCRLCLDPQCLGARRLRRAGRHRQRL
jgi:DHA1 family bicyclomycin/chloramphenicol resistance-like MFS transporter